MSDQGVDILLVEDDAKLAALTQRYLEQNGLSVVVEPRGDEALARFNQVSPRLVLLDLMLPGKDGIAVCRELREIFNGPILMLTAKDANIDQVVGLEAGADDYVAKPADPMVLLARIRVLLRRLDRRNDPKQQSHDIVIGGLRISDASQQVWLHDVEVNLTTQEFELLLELAKNAGTVLSRKTLYRRIRRIDYDGLDRTIDGRISRLRKKLNDNALTPQRIKTVWGKGYLLAPDRWDTE